MCGCWFGVGGDQRNSGVYGPCINICNFQSLGSYVAVNRRSKTRFPNPFS